jgi:hypothetical protein
MDDGAAVPQSNDDCVGCAGFTYFSDARKKAGKAPICIG